MRRIAVALQFANQSAEARRQDDEVARIVAGRVGVDDTGWYKHCCSWPGRFGSVCITERQLAFEHVPRFIIGMVDVQGCRPAATPFVNLKRFSSGGECGHRDTLRPSSDS